MHKQFGAFGKEQAIEAVKQTPMVSMTSQVNETIPNTLELCEAVSEYVQQKQKRGNGKRQDEAKSVVVSNLIKLARLRMRLEAPSELTEML